MSKIIKKQIERSLPWFVILALIISTSGIGLAFDFDIKLFNIVNKDSAFDMQIPLANAQNNAASTTVQVRNAPPTFTDDAAEVPASTALAPVNEGEAISFQARANDPEGAQYYLIVCSSNSVSAVNTTAPTCGGTMFCRSEATANNALASCTYNDVQSLTEATAWYAFVCDAHATEAECSPSNQGTGDSGSPMYVNHAPTLVSASTSDDNKEPGGTFTFSATATDPDTARGAGHDIISIYVCATDSWATSTGCASQLCTNTGEQGTVITCQWEDTAPTVDQAYTYYVFAKDEFNLPAIDNGASSTYTIINVAPVVSGVNLVPNSGNDVQLNLKGAANVLVTASTTPNNVYDANGCTDIQTATATIYYSAVAGGPNCSANDNDCYQIEEVSCVISDCDDSTDGYATITCTTTMAFHAIPTDASSFYSADTWHAAIRAFDEALSGIGTSTVGTDVKTVSALNVEETLINYGIIRSGTNSGTSTATTTIVNYGNSPLDTYLYGEDMYQGLDKIDIFHQKHDLAAYFNYDTHGTAATSTPSVNLVDVVIGRPTSQTNVLDHIYWGINIPSGTLSGTYSGTNTFTAAIDPLGW
jgi:hypothetical protein